MADPLLKKVRNGEIPEEAVNKKVRNILKLMIRLDLIGQVPYDTTGMAAKLAIPAHTKAAREIAEESLVLKNSKDMLPLDPAQYKNVAVIGAMQPKYLQQEVAVQNLEAKYEVTLWKGYKIF